MQKIRKGDTVVVTAGRSRGRQGVVLRAVGARRIVVEGANLVKKHVKPNPQAGQTGGIVEQEAALDVSNVRLLNPATGKADRVGFRTLEDGRKVRYFKSNGEVVDA